MNPSEIVNKNAFKTLTVGCVLVLTMAASFQRPARAASSPAVTLAIGVVDVDKVAAGAKQKAALDDQLKAMNQSLQEDFNQQTNALMLTKDEQDTLYGLLNKPVKTDADTAQITELESISSKDASELAALQQEKNPSDSDTQRLAVLSGEKSDSDQILTNIAQEYRDEAQSETDKLQQQLLDSINAAIAAVAQQRGLVLVFSKQVALYGAIDITSDVLAHLNKS